MSQPDDPATGPRDVFLAVYLPYVVGTHFLRLEILSTAERRPLGAEAQALVRAELATLPVRGPEIVSVVLEVEHILAVAGVGPPAPPRTLAEHGAWTTKVLEAMRPFCVPADPQTASVSAVMRANASLYTARALGDAEQTLRLAALVDALRALHSGDAWLDAQLENLDKARIGSLVHLRDLAGEGSVKLASPLGSIVVDAVTKATHAVEKAVDPPHRAEAARALARHARTIERCMLLPRARDRLAEAHAAKIGWRAALRPMLEMPGWSVRADDPVEQDGGKHVIRVFSDADAMRASGSAGTFLTTTAWGVLQQVDARADELVVDPGEPHETRIARADFGPLQHLCFSARIEGVVRDWGDVDVGALRAFEEYRILYDDTRVLHAWAPDHAGRRYAAVFTSDDAIQAYLARMPAPEGAKVGWAAGAKLFRMLAETSAPGIVFDPLGPPRPRRFLRPFLEQLAREDASPRTHTA